jgi:hypothetical protein
MSFDPNTFLNTTYEEANDTKVMPCPAGEYLAIADKVDINTWSKRDGSASGIKADIVWEIQDENVKALLSRSKVTSRQTVMLDTTDTGALDLGKGRNIGLGRLREALGLNTPGEPFSFGMIQGRVATVVVSHRSGENPEDIYDEIKKVGKPS